VRPDHPVVGVGGVVVHENRVLLIKRGKEPMRGRWVVPGGTVELGETIEEALVREMKEETDLRVTPVEMLTVFDRIQRDMGEIAYHYVIVDYLCRYEGGEARAGSDAEAVAWARPDELASFDLPDKALEVVEQALTRAEVLARRPTGG
jgi:8-oxo-dGTP diphosphatase